MIVSSIFWLLVLGCLLSFLGVVVAGIVDSELLRFALILTCVPSKMNRRFSQDLSEGIQFIK